MTRPRIDIIAAVSRNGVIGRNGDMPWKLSTDLKRFKSLTLGKPVIVGRKTFDSFGGRPLPGRPHVVVTRNRDFHPEGVDTAVSVDEALSVAGRKAAELGVGQIFVIGGGEIYSKVLPLADGLHITHVETEIADGDTFFPTIDATLFEKVEEIEVEAGERDNYPTRFVTYRRRPAAN